MSNNLENDRSISATKMYPIDLAPQKITIVKSVPTSEVKMSHLVSGQGGGGAGLGLARAPQLLAAGGSTQVPALAAPLALTCHCLLFINKCKAYELFPAPHDSEQFGGAAGLADREPLRELADDAQDTADWIQWTNYQPSHSNHKPRDTAELSDGG